MNSALIRLKLPRLLYALLYGPSKTKKPRHWRGKLGSNFGGPCRARTYDPLIKRLVFELSGGVPNRPFESDI
jgi:hypothetical protein